MRSRFYLCLLVSILLTVAGAASADIITYSGSIDFNATGSGNVNVTQFNPSLGALTGVTVRIYQTAQASFAVDNDDVLARTAQAQMFRFWNLSGGAVSDSATDTFNSSSEALAADNGDTSATVDFTGPDGYNWGLVTGGGLHSTSIVASGNWTTYTGVGNVTYAVNMTTLVNALNTDSNDYQSQVIGGGPNQRIRVEVDYQYNPDYIPEPGTMALLSLGLGGLGIWRRRRAAAAA
jgi:hypothetical protein